MTDLPATISRGEKRGTFLPRGGGKSAFFTLRRDVFLSKSRHNKDGRFCLRQWPNLIEFPSLHLPMFSRIPLSLYPSFTTITCVTARLLALDGTDGREGVVVNKGAFSHATASAFASTS